MEYNSQRPDLVIPEYGRNIQNMVNHIKTIEDREERNRAVESVLKMMGQLFPYLRDMDDFKHKLWDHLHIMSDFELDVDSPYPKPSPETFKTKPNHMAYPQGDIRYGHYGKTIERLIASVAAEEDDEKREKQMWSLANLMKKTYLAWNRDTVKDEVIANQLKEMSKGKLVLDDPSKLQPTADLLKNLPATTTSSSGAKRKKGKSNRRKKR
ncbi:MAG: DUF4290 domain-containing protein [Cryomorphaceae bacterium]|nr:MAG: DUF4290 domain-containing protein [Cryomorphaceae bacterium]